MRGKATKSPLSSAHTISPGPTRLILYTDGASRGNPGPAAIGALILDEAGQVLQTLSETIGIATNNVAEYTALLRAIEIAHRMSPKALDCRMDSELIVLQMRGVYRIKHPKMVALAQQVRAVCLKMPDCAITFSHVRRAYNGDADALANAALDKEDRIEDNGVAESHR